MLAKLLEMTIDLISHEQMTAAQLAAKMEVSVRTVYRYMDALSEAGIPVFTQKGRGGGIKVGSEFRLPAMFLTRDELDMAIAALSSQKEVATALSARDKLLTLKTRRPSSAAAFYNDNYVVENSDAESNAVLSDKMSSVIDAKRRRQILRICYHDYNGNTTTRDIDPYFLVYHDGNWYVNAFCHLRKDMRLFKIARITHISYTGGVFLPVSKERTYTFNMKPRAQKIDMVLRVTPEGRYEAEDWLGVENVRLSDDGVNYLAAGVVYDDEGTYAKIIKFGKNATVISPASLKEAVIKMCRGSLAVNGGE